MRNSQRFSACIRTPCSDSRRCLASVSIRPQQIIAEVGPSATTFSTAKRLASWLGACPGHDESAGIDTVTAPGRQPGTCVACSIKLRTRGEDQGAVSLSCSTGCSSAVSAMLRRSARLPIGCVGCWADHSLPRSGATSYRRRRHPLIALLYRATGAVGGERRFARSHDQ